MPPPNRLDVVAAGCDAGAGAAGVVDPKRDVVFAVAPPNRLPVAPPLDGGVCAGVVDAKLKDVAGFAAAGVVEPLGAAEAVAFPNIPPDRADEVFPNIPPLAGAAEVAPPPPNKLLAGAAPVEVPNEDAAGFVVDAGVFSSCF